MPPSADILIGKLRQAGAFAIGFAPLREVPPEVMDAYTAWIAAGHHGGMDYLANHIDIRSNPALLLDGGEDPRPGGTVISMAFPYCSGDPYHPGRLRIARYALGDDYHEVLRQRLRPVAAWITGETGKEARICVDTAPILERHWAREAGLGFIGRNRQLIIPGHGPCFFLAEIVTARYSLLTRPAPLPAATATPVSEAVPATPSVLTTSTDAAAIPTSPSSIAGNSPRGSSPARTAYTDATSA